MKILKKFIREEIGRNLKSPDQVGNISVEDILKNIIQIEIITDYDSNDKNIFYVKVKVNKKYNFSSIFIKNKIMKYNGYTKHFNDLEQASLFKNNLEIKLKSIIES